jgi:lysophospholipase L1-like esterase
VVLLGADKPEERFSGGIKPESPSWRFFVTLLYMKYLIIVSVLVVAYMAFYLGRIYYFSNYSPNPKISQSDFTIGTGPTLRYVAAGDSTAVGLGASTAAQSYPQRLARSLAETHTVEYRNIAVSGSQTQDVIAKQLDQIVALKPDVVTISIGGNDATHAVSQKVLLANYQTIIERLTRDTTAQIYISDIPNFVGAKLLPFWAIWLIEYRSSYLNPGIMALATDRAHIINIHDFGKGQYPDIAATYSLDHFHPNDLGYTNWYNAFWDQLKNYK